MVAAIDGKVVVQVDALFAKFKEEMLKCVKDMVSAMCKDFGGANNGTSNIHAAVPNEAAGQPSRTSPVEDVNGNTIQNILRNLSDYSTPPRVNHTPQVCLICIYIFSYVSLLLLVVVCVSLMCI